MSYRDLRFLPIHRGKAATQSVDTNRCRKSCCVFPANPMRSNFIRVSVFWRTPRSERKILRRTLESVAYRQGNESLRVQRARIEFRQAILAPIYGPLEPVCASVLRISAGMGCVVLLLPKSKMYGRPWNFVSRCVVRVSYPQKVTGSVSKTPASWSSLHPVSSKLRGTALQAYQEFTLQEALSRATVSRPKPIYRDI